MTTTYTTIKPSSSNETITIIHTEHPSTIHAIAASTSVTYILQHEPDWGLAIDFSELISSSWTVNFVRSSGASHSIKIERGSESIVILDEDTTEHEARDSCGGQELVYSLFLLTGLESSEWGPDPKIKIIPPSCS